MRTDVEGLFRLSEGYLVELPGNGGANRYGPDPRGSD
jgi:hypothetical protein